MYTLFLLTNIMLDIDQNVKRHFMNGASQNTVISTKKNIVTQRVAIL